MVHPGSRLWDSALVIDLSQLPSASPAGSYHLNHSDSILAIRAKTLNFDTPPCLYVSTIQVSRRCDIGTPANGRSSMWMNPRE